MNRLPGFSAEKALYVTNIPRAVAPSHAFSRSGGAVIPQLAMGVGMSPERRACLLDSLGRYRGCTDACPEANQSCRDRCSDEQSDRDRNCPKFSALVFGQPGEVSSVSLTI